MEISNRKLFSRGIAAIGFAVAFSGVPGGVFAAEQPEASAAVAPSGAENHELNGQEEASRPVVCTPDSGPCKELSAQEEEARRAKFEEQDRRLNEARKLEDFEKKVEAFRGVIAELATPDQNFGMLGQERHRLFLKELEALKLARGNELLSQAKQAAAETRYPNAIQLATAAADVSKPERQPDGSQTDSPLQAEVGAFIEFCRTRQHALETRQATDVANSFPQHAANEERIKQLLKEARVFYNARRYDEAVSRLEEVYLIDPLQREAIQLMNDIYKRVYTAGLHRREADIAGIQASDIWQWVEPVFPVSAQPTVSEGIRKESAEQGTLVKLERIVFPRFEYENADVRSVLNDLSNRSKLFDPEKEGVSISYGFGDQNPEDFPPVTMSLSNIPLSELIRYVCQNTGLKYRVEESGVTIGPNVDEIQQQSFHVRADLIADIEGDVSESAGADLPPGEPAPPTGAPGEGGEEGELSKTFLDRGSSRKASVTSQALMNYFSARGVSFGSGSSILYEKGAGRLIVNNTPENLQRMDELIHQLDAIQNPLVMVEIKGIEISETDMQELGFDWSMDVISQNMEFGSNGKPSLQSGKDDGWAFGQGMGRFPNVRGETLNADLWSMDSRAVVNKLNIFPAIFGRQSIFGSDVPLNLYLTVNALSQNSRTETLSAPKVMTTSGNTASVRMVKSYWFPTEWDEYEIDADDGNVTITIPNPDFEEYDDVGIMFDVRPSVNADNYTITLDVNPSFRKYIGKDEYPMYVVSERYLNGEWEEPRIYQFNVWEPIISSRKLHVNVTVYDGETIVLGGMIDSSVNQRTDKWPLLGDLPFVGRFFSSQAEDKVRSNLLLFVTTRLVNQDGIPIRRGQQNGAPDFNR